MNQQQLQNARAAHWHQTSASTTGGAVTSAALLTFDEAAPWLEETGLCLFLPRYTQLAAPAPSFVEATLGSPSRTPSPKAIEAAMELATRLVAAKKAVPLNLLGNFTEQPDFLVTPDALPWVAAVRGDRQWKTSPGGRTTPIVLRTWDILENDGDRTAAEIQEDLGREVTEAAVQRALIELWTTLRAIPSYTPGEPTRWSLLKDVYAGQLATGANTAQPTALSALVSLYLRQAIAATAEEVEIFLSPLTARSRIREVVHGMQATRVLGTTSLASQTLLFIEGTLPEFAPAPEEKGEAPAHAEAEPQHRVQSERPAGTEQHRPGAGETRERREPRPRDGGRTFRKPEDRSRGERPRFQDGGDRARRGPNQRPQRGEQPGGFRRSERPGGGQRSERPGGFQRSERPGGFQRRSPSFGERGKTRDEGTRPAAGERRERPFARPGAPKPREEAQRRDSRGTRDERPWQKKGPQRSFGAKRFEGGRRETGRPERPERGASEGEARKGSRYAGERPERGGRERKEFQGNRPFRPARPGNPKPGEGAPSRGGFRKPSGGSARKPFSGFKGKPGASAKPAWKKSGKGPGTGPRPPFKKRSPRKEEDSE